MNNQTVNLLATHMDEAYQTLRQRLNGLSDAEFLWEPVPGCWSLLPDVSGRWVVDYITPDPEPPPFTTIGWRIVHVATCKVMYYEYAFCPAKLTWDTLDYPHTAESAVALLEEDHSRFKLVINKLNDMDLESFRLTNWGETWPTWRIFWTMIFHDLVHGGEIACLGDLYRELNA